MNPTPPQSRRPRQAATRATATKIEELCRYIEQHSDQPLDLDALGKRAHLSPFHLQRNFKAATGVTPRQYLEACRLGALKRELRDGGAVSSAIYGAGFGSASRVYERVATRLGMTPRQYRAGGRDVAISYAAAPTALGLLMMGATDRGLCFVQFGDDGDALLERLRTEYPGATLTPMQPQMSEAFDHWMQALAAHLAGSSATPTLPLDVRGTAFQMKVWRYLQAIPCGDVQSYAEVAAAIGQPRAVRAVANACASNHVALLIPCHRVIRGDGSLGGYKWGLERKRALLDGERANRRAARTAACGMRSD